MAQVQYVIDSIRVGVACPDELTLILKQKECTNTYLPAWISQHEGQTLANVLHGRPDSEKELDTFLADNHATDSDIGCATIYLEHNSFFAKVLLSQHHKPYEVRCPIGLALALAVRANVPILADETLFDRAGVRLSATSCEPHRQPS